MASDSIIFRSLAHSNMPRHHKESLISRMLGSAKSEMRRATNTKSHHMKEALVGSGVSALTGGLLGMLHASEGLDIKGKVPADVLLGVVGIAASGSEILCNAGKAGFTTFFFRQGYAFMAEKKRSSGGTPVGFAMLGKGSAIHGELSAGSDVGAEDPIRELAKQF